MELRVVEKKQSLLEKCTKFSLAAVVALGSVGVNTVLAESDYSGWNVGFGGGMHFYEGDEEVKSSQIYEIRVGYDFDPTWTVEGTFGYLPFMDNKRYDPPSSSPENDRFQLQDDTWGLRTAADVLYHFNDDPGRTFDPFAAVTGGVRFTDATLENDQHFDPFGGVGFGAAYEFMDNWLVRGDYRFLVVGHDSEYNHLALASLGYRWGHRESDAGDRDAEGSKADSMDKEGRTLVTIYFEFDSAVLTEAAKAKLRQNAEYLRSNPNAKVVLEGHCDERGTNEYNFALGQRRAASAFEYLRSLGIPAERMNPISFGEERPADGRSNEEAWAKNRRVECKVRE